MRSIRICRRQGGYAGKKSKDKGKIPCPCPLAGKARFAILRSVQMTPAPPSRRPGPQEGGYPSPQKSHSAFAPPERGRAALTISPSVQGKAGCRMGTQTTRPL